MTLAATGALAASGAAVAAAPAAATYPSCETLNMAVHIAFQNWRNAYRAGDAAGESHVGRRSGDLTRFMLRRMARR